MCLRTWKFITLDPLLGHTPLSPLSQKSVNIGKKGATKR